MTRCDCELCNKLETFGEEICSSHSKIQYCYLAGKLSYFKSVYVDILWLSKDGMSVAVVTCCCYMQRQGGTVQEKGKKVKETAVTYFKLLFRFLTFRWPCIVINSY